MSWNLAIPSAVLAALLVAGGVAALRTGWVMPWQRRWVHRPRLFGWAMVTVAGSAAFQASTALIAPRGIGAVAQGAALGLLLAGMILLTLSQRPAPAA
ncbi:hypothetical protein ACFV2S_33240 [Streptomyces sp. NPDC059695]|uniref:hypothetical protein n=1 Tax=Streptomyces sp. NPDC059695 TaxID=3346910 RepID=UPI0036A05E81